MDDLIAFLRERLDEDERVASAAKGNSLFDGTGIVTGPRASVAIISTVAIYIARYDPTRALDEVEAKRRILDEFAQDLAAPVITIDGVPQGTGRRDRARSMVRLLALPYAGHEAYKEDWKL